MEKLSLTKHFWRNYQKDLKMKCKRKKKSELNDFFSNCKIIKNQTKKGKRSLSGRYLEKKYERLSKVIKEREESLNGSAQFFFKKEKMLNSKNGLLSNYKIKNIMKKFPDLKIFKNHNVLNQKIDLNLKKINKLKCKDMQNKKNISTLYKNIFEFQKREKYKRDKKLKNINYKTIAKNFLKEDNLLKLDLKEKENQRKFLKIMKTKNLYSKYSREWDNSNLNRFSTNVKLKKNKKIYSKKLNKIIVSKI